MFTTWDVDQDSCPDNCATIWGGAWWYNWCISSQLTGAYIDGGHLAVWEQGIIWQAWKDFLYSLKHTEMKIRPN